jgi:hypothetical protein
MYEAIIIINCLLLLLSFSLNHKVLTDFNKNSCYETFANRSGVGSIAVRGEALQKQD